MRNDLFFCEINMKKEVARPSLENLLLMATVAILDQNRLGEGVGWGGGEGVLSLHRMCAFDKNKARVTCFWPGYKITVGFSQKQKVAE